MNKTEKRAAPHQSITSTPSPTIEFDVKKVSNEVESLIQEDFKEFEDIKRKLEGVTDVEHNLSFTFEEATDAESDLSLESTDKGILHLSTRSDNQGLFFSISLRRKHNIFSIEQIHVFESIQAHFDVNFIVKRIRFHMTKDN